MSRKTRKTTDERERLRELLWTSTGLDAEQLAALGAGLKSLFERTLEAQLDELLAQLVGARRLGRRALPPRKERVAALLRELSPSSGRGFASDGGERPPSWRVELAAAMSSEDLYLLPRSVKLASLRGLIEHGRLPDSSDGLDEWLTLADVLAELGLDERLTIDAAEPMAMAQLTIAELLLPDGHPALVEAGPAARAAEWMQARAGARGSDAIDDDPVLAEAMAAWLMARGERRWSALMQGPHGVGEERALERWDELSSAMETLFDRHLSAVPLEVLELGRAREWRVRGQLPPLVATPTLGDLPSSSWDMLGRNMGTGTLAFLTARMLEVMRDWRRAAAAARHPDALEPCTQLPVLQELVRTGRLDLWSPLADEEEEAGEQVAAAPGRGTYYEFEVTLSGSKPRIWRRFQLRADGTFFDLHRAIQDAFGWEYAHLWEFRVRRQVLACGGHDDMFFGRGKPPPAAHELALAAYFEHQKACDYLYDFGDGWLHQIKLRRTVELPPSEARFERRLLAGREPAPPEDCGGLWGYYDLREDPESRGWPADAFADERFDLAAARAAFDA